MVAEKKQSCVIVPLGPPALQSNCLQWDGYRLLRNQNFAHTEAVQEGLLALRAKKV